MDERVYQLADVALGVEGGGGEAQPFLPDGNCRVIDRLRVDQVVFEEAIADRLAKMRIPHNQRHDVGACLDHRKAGLPKLELQGIRNLGLLLPEVLAGADMPDRGERACGDVGGKAMW